jgi:hypothetical protein
MNSNANPNLMRSHQSCDADRFEHANHIRARGLER